MKITTAEFLKLNFGYLLKMLTNFITYEVRMKVT